jgi:hypothetical protein
LLIRQGLESNPASNNRVGSRLRQPKTEGPLRLETHLAAMADNKSPLVSEYVRTFVKRMEEQRPPEQLSLRIG